MACSVLRAMAAEATAWLHAFRVQHEAIAAPAGGWRELELLSRCRAAADARGGVPAANGSRAQNPSSSPTLEHTCAAIAAVRAGGFVVRGAAFSALRVGTRLLAHSGPTNRRNHAAAQTPD